MKIIQRVIHSRHMSAIWLFNDGRGVHAFSGNRATSAWTFIKSFCWSSGCEYSYSSPHGCRVQAGFGVRQDRPER